MTMRDVIRVVLVDPNEESRQDAATVAGVTWALSDRRGLPSYQAAASRIAEIAPDLCLVRPRLRPGQAVELIASCAQGSLNARGASGQRDAATAR